MSLIEKLQRLIRKGVRSAAVRVRWGRRKARYIWKEEKYEARLKNFAQRFVIGAKPFWIMLGGFFLAFLIACATTSTVENASVVGGCILQVLGVLTVAIGVRDKRRLFNKPSVIENVRRWLKSIRNAPKKPITATFNQTGGAFRGRITMSATGNTEGVSQPQSIEEKIETILERQEALEEHVNEMRRKLNEKASEAKQAVGRERKKRREQVNELQNLIEEFSTGGLHIEGIGVTWLVFGIPLSTLPEQITTLL